MPIFLPRKPDTQPLVVCFCHPVNATISAMVAPPFRFGSAITSSLLDPVRAAFGSLAGFDFLATFVALGVFLATFVALGVFLAGVAFLLALAFAGAPLADRAPPLPFFPAFGFAGVSSGCAASPRPLMRSQMRLAAALLLLKLSTGVTPVRLLKIETSRSAGQALASSASSFWLPKLSKGVAVAAAASSWVENAEMLFCSSMVKVVIIVLLGAALCAVIT